MTVQNSSGTFVFSNRTVFFESTKRVVGSECENISENTLSKSLFSVSKDANV